MKIGNQAEVRTIHPDVLNEMTMEAAICMLGVARDLRDGTIKQDHFTMFKFHSECGTAHCICGWMEHRLGKIRFEFIDPKNEYHKKHFSSRQEYLFSGGNPSNPNLAADAIENYLFNYAENPWNRKYEVRNR